jgi:hypothetical protein
MTSGAREYSNAATAVNLIDDTWVTTIASLHEGDTVKGRRAPARLITERPQTRRAAAAFSFSGTHQREVRRGGRSEKQENIQAVNQLSVAATPAPLFVAATPAPRLARAS